MLSDLTEQLKGLDLDSKGNVKSTVANIKLLGSLKGKLTNLVVNDDYLAAIKDFVNAFNAVTDLQNAYWSAAEKSFRPTPLLREIRTQAITDTVNMLTENGIGVNISENIASILRQNITTGGSYKSLENQLRESLTDTQKSDGLLTKYAKQVTTDSINQYNRQYTQVVASGFNYEWYSYANSLIKTSRPFCIAMHERDYFHVSEIPDLLDATDLFYTNPKTGKREQVPIYSGTGLPAGMYDNENEDNFLILLGGYNCGHQARPVSEALVTAQAPDIVARVKASPAFAAFNSLTS